MIGKQEPSGSLARMFEERTVVGHDWRRWRTSFVVSTGCWLDVAWANEWWAERASVGLEPTRFVVLDQDPFHLASIRRQLEAAGHGVRTTIEPTIVSELVGLKTESVGVVVLGGTPESVAVVSRHLRIAFPDRPFAILGSTDSKSSAESMAEIEDLDGVVPRAMSGALQRIFDCLVYCGIVHRALISISMWDDLVAYRAAAPDGESVLSVTLRWLLGRPQPHAVGS